MYDSTMPSSTSPIEAVSSVRNAVRIALKSTAGGGNQVEDDHYHTSAAAPAPPKESVATTLEAVTSAPPSATPAVVRTLSSPHTVQEAPPARTVATSVRLSR